MDCPKCDICVIFPSLWKRSEKNVRAEGDRWLQRNNTFQTCDSIHKTCANSSQPRPAQRPTPNQGATVNSWLLAETLGFLALVSKLCCSGKVAHVRGHVQHRMDLTSAKREERRPQSCMGREGNARSRKS